MEKDTPRVLVTLEDMKGGTKEEFKVTGDAALIVSTMLHLLHGTSPKQRITWHEACKIVSVALGTPSR